MYSVIYVSSAYALFSQRELDDLLLKSRENNHRLGLTGMLLYKDGNFMQVLEGPREVVDRLLARIEADPRHHGVLKLLERENEDREFGDWSMGFKRLDRIDVKEVPGFSDFLNNSLIDDVFRKNPTRTLQLLFSFRKVVS